MRDKNGPTVRGLQNDYSRTTDCSYSVWHHFYDYVYDIIRYVTLTFFGPYCTWKSCLQSLKDSCSLP